MALCTLIPRTIVGVTYPAFASLKAVLSDSPESCGAWLRSEIIILIIMASTYLSLTLSRYWVVLGVFSLVELLLDLCHLLLLLQHLDPRRAQLQVDLRASR